MKTVSMAARIGVLATVVVCGQWMGAAHAEWVTVQRVVDGDTFVLTDDTRVRVKGIDTPETKNPRVAPEPGGEQATQYARTVLGGRTVWLDGQSSDKYGRRLADVTVAGSSYADMVRNMGYDKKTSSTGPVVMPFVPATRTTPVTYGAASSGNHLKTQFVSGYTRSDGTYVRPYFRSSGRR